MTVAPEAPGARRPPWPPRTELPGLLPRTEAPGGERRRTLSALRDTDVYAVVGALAAALALTWLLFTRLLPFDGVVGFVVTAYGFFLLLYALLVSFDESGPAVVDRIAAAVVRSLGLLLVAILAVVVVYALVEGRKALVHLNFFTQDMELAGPLEPLSVGGALHAALGTLIMIVIALVVTVPLGLVCAVFLNEVPGPFARFVRTIVEAMTALPSIVAGLFIYATVILGLGMDQSGLAASFALSVMMLPIIIRAADVVIRLVPGTLREAAYATGASSWRTAWHVVLPTCRSGLTTSVILGTARGIGETSPVLLTAGFTSETNLDPLHGPMVSLPLATFEFVKSPEPAMASRGFGTASLLMALVLLLFVAARVVGGRGPGHLTRRQEHRRVTASRRDASRFAERGTGAPPPAARKDPAPGAARPTGTSGPAGASGPATPQSSDPFRTRPGSSS
ncbi:phosphate ABC transporter permease PstA [Streptomyces sp. enrichment culture]|uniref:phosphate ABC transporter permease PstA n=1 Tax=Streptomyces sp. enrichment culture TaxID=1795815 RepID=UPI003F54877B